MAMAGVVVLALDDDFVLGTVIAVDEESEELRKHVSNLIPPQRSEGINSRK
jgi:hypothetical protein